MSTDQPSPDQLRVAGWLLEKRIGRGTYGVVWRVRRESVGLTRAMKLVAIDSESAFRNWREEVRWLDDVQSDAIVRILDADITADTSPYPGHGYVLMEEGKESLEDQLARRGGRLAERDCRSVLAALLSALDAAQTAGAVHRDIKPGNLILFGENNWQLSDWGTARMLPSGADRPATKQVAGTPDYMAPWAFLGAQDHRADLYSAGVTIHRALCGELVHPDSPTEMDFRAHGEWLGQQPLELHRAVSPRWQPVVRALLAGRRPTDDELPDSVATRRRPAERIEAHRPEDVPTRQPEDVPTRQDEPGGYQLPTQRLPTEAKPSQSPTPVPPSTPPPNTCKTRRWPAVILHLLVGVGIVFALYALVRLAS